MKKACDTQMIEHFSNFKTSHDSFTPKKQFIFVIMVPFFFF